MKDNAAKKEKNMKRIEVVGVALYKIHQLSFIDMNQELMRSEKQRLREIIEDVLDVGQSIPGVKSLYFAGSSLNEMPVGSKIRFYVDFPEDRGRWFFTIAASFAGSCFEDVDSELFEHNDLLKSVYEFLFQEANGVSDEALNVKIKK